MSIHCEVSSRLEKRTYCTVADAIRTQCQRVSNVESPLPIGQRLIFAADQE